MKQPRPFEEAPSCPADPANPLVSVLIPTYHRAKVIGRAVGSVLGQTYRNIEVLVVDDNGHGTPEQIQTESALAPMMGDGRLRYLTHPVNRNGSAARNTGIRSAKGSYMAFLDDDDEMLPRRIERMLNRMEGLDGAWGGCYSRFMRRKGKRILDYGIESEEGDVYFRLLLRNFYICAGSNMFVRREVFDKVGLFNEHFSRNQDLEMLLRITRHYKLAHVGEILLVVHKDEKTFHSTAESFTAVNETFLSTFAAEIAELPENMKRQLGMLNALDYARRAYMQGHVLMGCRRLRDAGVPLLTAMKYGAYLFRRKVWKLCYGFQIRE